LQVSAVEGEIPNLGTIFSPRSSKTNKLVLCCTVDQRGTFGCLQIWTAFPGPFCCDRCQWLRTNTNIPAQSRDVITWCTAEFWGPRGCENENWSLLECAEVRWRQWLLFYRKIFFHFLPGRTVHLPQPVLTSQKTLNY